MATGGDSHAATGRLDGQHQAGVPAVPGGTTAGKNCKAHQRAPHLRVPLPGAGWPNQRGSMDFVSDRLINGRWFRILMVVDQIHARVSVRVRRSLPDRRKSVHRCSAWRPLVDCRNPSPPIMAASSWEGQWKRGLIEPASNSTSFGPASRSKTALSRASTAGCEMNV